jgi:hypothetical protein
MRKNIMLGVLSVSLLVIGCGDSEDMPVSSTFDGAGQLIGYQNYLALGNSLTAGYQASAWGAEDDVEMSFPNQLATQLGISDFKQWSVPGNGIGTLGGTMIGRLELSFASGTPTPTPTSPSDPALLTAEDNENYLKAPRNLGIPGIPLGWSMSRSLDDIASTDISYAAAYVNQYSVGLNQVQVAANSGADFITMWLGNNDVLAYVTSGGFAPITPVDSFNAAFGGALQMLGAVDNIVALNIPAVTSLPFVTYMNDRVMADMDAMMGQTLPAHPIYVQDPVTQEITMHFIDAGNDNYILLSASSELAQGKGFSEGLPLSSVYFLDSAELAIAQAAVSSFNAGIIAGATAINTVRVDAGQPEVLLIDMNAYFSEIVENGVDVHGNTFTTTFGTGGLFSLDGVHPSALGYSLVTNKIIETMNSDWGLNVEPVELGEVAGVTGFNSEGPIAIPDLSDFHNLFRSVN